MIKKDIVEAVKKELDTELLGHTLRVEELAVQLAKKNEVNIECARMAALLHDFAKIFGPEKLVELAKEFKIDITVADKKHPSLLHAPVGAAIALERFKVTSDVANAIEAHTYGRYNMSKLDKIIYLADSLEPGRKNGHLNEIRKLLFEDIDKAFSQMYAYTLQKIIKKNRAIHPKSVEVWNQIVGK